MQSTIIYHIFIVYFLGGWEGYMTRTCIYVIFEVQNSGDCKGHVCSNLNQAMPCSNIDYPLCLYEILIKTDTNFSLSFEVKFPMSGQILWNHYIDCLVTKGVLQITFFQDTLFLPGLIW